MMQALKAAGKSKEPPPPPAETHAPGKTPQAQARKKAEALVPEVAPPPTKKRTSITAPAAPPAAAIPASPAAEIVTPPPPITIERNEAPPALPGYVEAWKQTGVYSMKSLVAGPAAAAPAAAAVLPAAPAAATWDQITPGGPAAAPAASPAAAPAAPPGCMPSCTWQCATQKCDQVCKPNCQAPQCQTRCMGVSTLGCRTECGKPDCAVVCPERNCASGKCPLCFTQCTKPMCRLVCPTGAQDCTDVCENPKCSWDCHAPAVCPEPTCKMTCAPPTDCMGGAAATFPSLPPLMDGQRAIQNFVHPIALLEQVPVAVTTATSLSGGSDLKLVDSNVTLPVVYLANQGGYLAA